MAAPLPPTGPTPIVLAYSGGLDTSFLVPWLAERERRPVITVTVDTGGIDAAAARTLAERARALGAVAHHQVDARADYFEQVLRFLIMGNVRRGAALPAVRRRRARHAGADHRAHGARARLATPSRTAAPRPATTRCASRSRCAPWPPTSRCWRRCATRPSGARTSSTTCRRAACRVPPTGAKYSVNRGLWGVTIGGTRDPHLLRQHPRGGLDPDARRVHAAARARSATRCASQQGRPVALDGRALEPVALIEALEALAAPYGIGRGIHLGDTIIGTKGRVAFEAPAAEVLLSAHRELEKLVLTGRQQRIKELLAQPYGDLVHEGQLLDPVCRDIEALFASSQQRVTGEVHVLLRTGALFVEGVDSPYSLMAASRGVYGEAAGEWSASRRARLLAHRRAARGVSCARR